MADFGAKNREDHPSGRWISIVTMGQALKSPFFTSEVSHMTLIALTFGSISGLVVITGIILSLVWSGNDPSTASQLVGYLIMFIALSIIFFGIKRHRDVNCGGVIAFLPALGLGLLISAVASIAYVVVWELYLALSGSNFMEAYAAAHIEEQEALGVAGAELQALRAEMELLQVRYENPLFRIPITMSEILPVGVVISLISAALLRNPRILPAR